MHSSSELLSKVEAALGSVAYPHRPEGLYEPIQYALEAGGKRVRPVLTLLAYQLFKDDVEQAIPAALCFETYHNHTLLHDDLMDNADVRRGRPSVHRKWDANTAILSGDTMLIMAFQHLLASPCVRQQDLLELATRTMLEVCEGQQYDVNFETRTDVTQEEYIEMIRLKTSVLLAGAAKAGALIADASDEDAQAVYHFAEKVGLAFQVQDDYLDVYGDPAVFGKAIGGDILCAKKTFLLINALNRCNAEERGELLQVLENKEMPAAEKIAYVTEVYNRLGIPQLCEETMARFYDEARSYLNKVNADEPRKEPLWNLAASLLKRKS